MFKCCYLYSRDSWLLPTTQLSCTASELPPTYHLQRCPTPPPSDTNLAEVSCPEPRFHKKPLLQFQTGAPRAIFLPCSPAVWPPFIREAEHHTFPYHLSPPHHKPEHSQHLAYSTDNILHLPRLSQIPCFPNQPARALCSAAQLWQQIPCQPPPLLVLARCTAMGAEVTPGSQNHTSGLQAASTPMVLSPLSREDV